MIAYLDTSAIVPLVVAEPTSARCRQLWNAADAVLCAALGYVEAVAALARAHRSARMTADQLAVSRQRLDDLWEQCIILPVDDLLVREAASLAVRHRLRGYDAVHCAAALRHRDSAVVPVTGDRDLLAAWRASGLDVADTTS